MNTAQQVIKALAIALAVLIIGGMISGIVIAGMTLSYIFDDRGSDSAATVIDRLPSSDEGEAETITELRIKTQVASLLVMSGDELQVKADDNQVEIYQDGDRLEVREKDAHFWERWGNKTSQIVVVLPSDLELDLFSLDSGAGKVEIRNVTAKQATINLGAGKTEITQLIATETVEIDGGAGHLTVRESKLRNLDLDMGVGVVEIEAELSGANQFDAGVGKLELNLLGGAERYQFKIERGLGSITLDGEKVGDEAVRGSGDVIVDINGGVGAIQIRTN